MAFPILVFLLAISASCSAVPSGLSGVRWLFPETKTYRFDLKCSTSTGSLLPAEGGSHNALHARLSVLVYNETRIRMVLDQIKTTLYSSNEEGSGNASAAHGVPPEAEVLEKPWEAHYLMDSGMLYDVRIPEDEPIWSANIKRALSISLQLVRVNATETLYKKSYTVVEPCLHDTCAAEYSGVDSSTVRKWHAIPASVRGFGRNIWFSVRPDTCNKDIKQPLVGSAERVYELDERGLASLELRSSIEYHSHSHLLAVVTSMSLYRDEVSQLQPVDGAALNSTYPAYFVHSYKEPTNMRAPMSQEQLLDRTRELLTRVSESIDRDNITPNADKIHSLDIIKLHQTMSQLSLSSLKSLKNELHVGTSYLNETNKNIFLETLPHIKSADSAKLIKFMIIEFNDQKFEDATALSLIRKLPFNIKEYSQELLLHMEDLLNLPPDVPKEIRHASILSFATLAFHTYINSACTSDEFESYVQKYFRMYTECPKYEDRMVWLQGLANLQVGSVSSYLSPIIQDRNVSRHERLLAIWATMPVAKFTPELTTSLYWPILTDVTEHIQLRISAMVMLLQGEQSPVRILNLHRYISNSGDGQLKRFWYTTVKSLEKSSYSCFSPLSKLTSYVSGLVESPGTKHWATGNHILDTSDDDRDYSAMIQLMTIARPLSGNPDFFYLALNSNQAGLSTTQVGIWIKAEGVNTNLLKRILDKRTRQTDFEKMSKVLKEMKLKIKTLEPAHIEVIVNIQGKTVYAVHFNQSFENWADPRGPLILTLKDLLISENHVNQQLVQYPLQTEVELPTELGTPVTIQTIWSSFFSFRGTTTSPSSKDWEWIRKHDIHMRYHGTAVTTLSSYGPLLDSEHSVRIQQSTLAHAPLKFDLKFAKHSLVFSWLNEDPTGGVALHSRTQIGLSVGKQHNLTDYCPKCTSQYTIRMKDGRNTQGDPVMFFDCDRPLTAVELAEKLLDSNRANYNFFSSLRPSLLMVHLAYLLSVPPSGACGIIVPSRSPFHLESGTTLDLSVGLGSEFSPLREDDWMTKYDITFGVVLRRETPAEDIYFRLNGSMSCLFSDEKKKILLNVNGYQPRAEAQAHRYWQVCLDQEVVSEIKLDSDINDLPNPYEGFIKLMVNTSFEPSPVNCSREGTQLEILYSGRPVYNYTARELTRLFDVKVYGKDLPNPSFLHKFNLWPMVDFDTLVEKLSSNPINMSASIMERNNQVSVTLDGENKWQIRGESLAWLDSWTQFQMHRMLGNYRECRLQQGTVVTLSENVEPLEESSDISLILAHCTAKPRFAIFRLPNDGYRFMYYDHQLGRVTSTSYHSSKSIDIRTHSFTITQSTEGIRAEYSAGVLFFAKPSEVVIFVHDTLIDVVCGICEP